MPQDEYTIAGKCAIGSAVGTLAVLVYSLFIEFGTGSVGPRPWAPGHLAAIAVLDTVTKILGIYALLRFRHLLNRRYDFHAIDELILILIAGNVLIASCAYTVRILQWRNPPVIYVGAAIMATLGFALGIVGIVMALRLLRLNGNLNGYKKPLANTILAGSICFTLVITTYLGIVLMAVSDVLEALIFFHSDEELEELEIV